MSECKIKPCSDIIVVKRDAAQSKTEGGLYIPDQAKTRKTRGTVLAVGPGRVLDSGARAPMDCAVGDRVIFSAYGGTPVDDGADDEGERVLMLRQQEVLGVCSE